ncbi:MAG: aminoglycoside phosphotransferase family protein [Paraclostridium sp.]
MDKELIEDIPLYNSWKKIEKINYGWSDDIKFYIEDTNEEKYLLRVNSINKLEEKKKEFEIIKKYNRLDANLSKAMDIGLCNNGKNIYMLLSWVEGDSMEVIIEKLSEKEQYILGVKAGKILKAIHSIKVDKGDIPKDKNADKQLRKLEKYENSKYRLENDEVAINHIKSNIDLMCRLDTVYKHGDFHIGNLIYTNNKDIGVIDFNRWKCGDPYEEFYKLQSFTVSKSIPFAIGQLHGYFKGEPPIEFWKVQSVYVAHGGLYGIEWASDFGQKDIDNMTSICYEIFRDYNDFKLVIPKWYSDNKYRWEELYEI